jgi:hypothetical protein
MHVSPLLSALLVLGLGGSVQAGQLVAVDSTDNIYDIDMTTGVKTLIGTLSSNVGLAAGLARDPATGTVYLVTTTGDSLYTLDIPTGVATLIGVFSSTLVTMHGVEWDSSTGTLYGGSNGNLFTIDTTTATVTQVGTSGLSSFLNLGYVPATDTLYGMNTTTDSFYTIDRTTGVATLIGPMGSTVSNPHGLAYDTDSATMWMVDSSTDSLYTIDLATGAATLIGAHGGSSNILGLVYLPGGPPGTGYCFGDGSGTACPCGNAGAAGNGCASSVNANGGNLAATGAASIAADTLVLVGSGMPNASALYFQGTTQPGSGLGVLFGDGLRCVAGSVVRLDTKTNAGGTSQYPDVGDLAIGIKGANVAGGVRNYQCWYRNADPVFCTPSTFNLTNGVQVTWQP